MTESQQKWLRLAALALFFALAWWISIKTGVADKMNKEDLRSMIGGAGTLGLLLFVGLVCVGLFIQIPGGVFVAGAVVIYGYLPGMLVAFLSGLVAISVSFFICRAIGGNPLARIKSPRALRLLARLHERPIRTMGAMRVFMQMSPALNVALALSEVRFRDYLLAAILGMWVPVIVMGTAAQFFFG